VRVLLDYRPALRERTGVGEYAHEISAALTRRLNRADCLVLFSSSWKDRLDPQILPGTEVVDAHIPVRALNFAWHRLEWPPIERIAGPVDVAHSLHPLLMPARRAAQVVTVHDLHFLENPENAAAEIRRDYPALAGSHARRADAVITVSAFTSTRIQSLLSVPRDRITICPPGAPSWTPRDRQPPGGHLLFMGTIEPRKNVAVLLRAYAHLLGRRQDVPPLVLAGKVAPACQGILDEIGRPPLAGHVRHVGYVAGMEREQLYGDASMLILPSLEEGFGMPALEAMTIGVPVIVSDRGALPEVVGSAGMIVAADDHNGLAAAFERLLTDSTFAAQQAAAGIVQATHFSWDASASRLLEAYRSAIERRQALRPGSGQDKR
jgi:glycosyltransferase involved in cell wall biosynthesis